MGWESQVAVVTGSSRGLGRAIALKLASCGAAVCIHYATRADLGEQVVAEIEAAGGRSLGIGADIADPAQVASLIAQTTEQLGPITILVNNAGVVMSGTLDDYDHAAYQLMRHINVDGLLFTTRAVVSGMRAHGYGRVINLTSVAGIGTAMKRHAFYSATKAEVIQFTKRFAMEFGRDNITVNALAPGFIMTEMAREWLSKQGAEMQQILRDRTMMGRDGQVEDVAHAAAFLAAPESGWITGQVLRVDGGRMDFLGPP